MSLEGFRIFLRLVYFVDFLSLKEPLLPAPPEKGRLQFGENCYTIFKPQGKEGDWTDGEMSYSLRIESNIFIMLSSQNSRNSYSSQNLKDNECHHYIIGDKRH